MTYGYSQKLVDANKKADADSLGVALGRFCIEREITATQVAVELGVSRMTVYNWFWGEFTPSPTYAEQIERFMVRHKKRK
jgi:DNA-binding XRE family transcriptional regulator